MINNISTLSSQRTFLGGFSNVSDRLPVFVRRQQCPRCHVTSIEVARTEQLPPQSYQRSCQWLSFVKRIELE